LVEHVEHAVAVEEPETSRRPAGPPRRRYLAWLPARRERRNGRQREH
jgi:hypothetical protein